MLRRQFLRTAAGAAYSLLAAPPNGKKFDGIFPIMQTPFTESTQLDLDVLASQVRFLDRVGVQGVVWPQLASEYATLSLDERMKGAETVMAAGEKLKPAVVLGVQAGDTETAVRLARHAAGLGPDAIIALPPGGGKDLAGISVYYQAIARACDLPFFVQTIGDMSVEFTIELARRNPTMRYIKDEAGQTLPRLSEYQARGKELGLVLFTGGHGRTFIDELRRGSSGTMPAASFADLYVPVWQAWRAGRREEAMEEFGPVAFLVHLAQAYGISGLKYFLQLRGVFKNSRCRTESPDRLDSEARSSIEEAYRFVERRLQG
jgi:dihydrodipicolinate synthase/N-acetylneuraminate lyase